MLGNMYIPKNNLSIFDVYMILLHAEVFSKNLFKYRFSVSKFSLLGLILISSIQDYISLVNVLSGNNIVSTFVKSLIINNPPFPF